MVRKLLILSVLILGAQTSGFSQNVITLETGQIEYRILDNMPPDNSYEGSPYIDSIFVWGKVVGISKKYLMRHNPYRGTIEFRNEPDAPILEMGHQKDYKIVLDDGRTYKTVEYEQGRRIMLEYWSDESGNALYILQSVEFRPKEVASSSYGTDKPARFIRENDGIYYQFKDQERLKAFPEKWKLAVKEFSDEYLKEFIKTNDIDLKTPEGAMKVLKEVISRR